MENVPAGLPGTISSAAMAPVIAIATKNIKDLDSLDIKLSSR
jgi:phosphoribosylcarboxyaminoimidazole (NCAIR) mutase